MDKDRKKIGRKRVLIVDDEKEVCAIISSYLKRRGFTTQTTHNGRAAQQILQKSKPDLIILDVLMPVMDGFEFLQYLKGNSEYCKIPVIMLTIKKERKFVEKGISLEADFYLPKPFTFNNLMGFVNTILNE